ncbi:MAG: hypothetical protein MZU97_06205 [Bacillus subtilis]|nr:hypothetical protein [Bacillus subtilis]
MITEGLSEYGVDGNDLYITLLRSVGILSRGAIDTRGTPAGPQMKVPEAQCLGKQQARYAICVVDDPQELLMEADQFMGCVLTEAGVAQDSSKEGEIPCSLLNFDNPNIYAYAVKLPHNDEIKGLIVRLMNVSGDEQVIKIMSEHKFSSIKQVNSLEEDITLPVNFNEEIKFNPYQMKSFLLY